MGIRINSSRGKKSLQEVAKLATLAHNKKKIVITSVEPIEFLEVPTEEVVEATVEETEEFVAAEVDISPVNVSDLVDALDGKDEEVKIQLPINDPITEQSLRSELGALKKAGLKEYAEENYIDIIYAKTNTQIIEAIISASF